jgi:hypothetical protein
VTQSFDLPTVGCKVFAVLTENPATRDDDELLLSVIWSKESKAQDMPSFFIELVEGTLSHFESVRRTRQKIQEHHPSLRGEKWEDRHKMEAVICEQLTFFDRL